MHIAISPARRTLVPMPSQIPASVHIVGESVEHFAAGPLRADRERTDLVAHVVLSACQYAGCPALVAMGLIWQP